MNSEINQFSSKPELFTNQSPMKYSEPVASYNITKGSNSISNRQFNSAQNLSKTPEKSEWALLNKQRALEYERMKFMEKQIERQKKERLRSELQNQLNSKNNSKMIEREQSIKYKNYIIEKQNQAKRKQQEAKMKRISQEKSLQSLNYQANNLRHQKNLNSMQRLGNSLNIGSVSDLQRNNLKLKNRIELVDALDKQLYLKSNQKRVERAQEEQKIEENMRYQQDLENRNKRSKSYNQNPGIYQYYKRIALEKKMKEKDLQFRLVQEAKARQLEQQRKQDQKVRRRLSIMNNQVKSVLDDQVRYHQTRKSQERKINPQEHSYSVIGNIFKQKSSPYDKRKYFQYLQQQAQEQKHQKNKLNYMSDEQYCLNYNQLHKAVNGDYSFDKYIDRSVNIIGLENKAAKYNPLNSSGAAVNDPDAEVVRVKMGDIKEQHHRKINDSRVQF